MIVCDCTCFFSDKDKGRKLTFAKNLVSKILPDATVKTLSGKPSKSDKDFHAVRLEDFLGATEKETARKFCDVANVGVSDAVIESL